MTVASPTLPHDLEAEKYFLQAVLTEPQLLTFHIDKLQPEDFYRENHKLIYIAMRRLFQNNTPIDIITLKNELGAMNSLDSAGGYDFLLALMQDSGIPANAHSYVEIIRTCALRRRLIHTGQETVKLGYDKTQDIKDVVDLTQHKVLEVTRERLDRGLVALSQVIDDKLPAIQARIELGEAITGVTTGYTKLDEMTAGFQKSDLIILAARPGVGKTAFALNIAMNAAGIFSHGGETGGGETVKKNVVAIFTMEMPAEQIMMRMLSKVCRINLHQLRTARVEKKVPALLGIKQAKLRTAPIYIDDTPQLNTLDIKGKLRRLIQDVGHVDLVVVDYLQLMHSVQHYQSKVHEVSEISMGLKQVAREFDVPVLALSQLSRAPEKRSTKDMRPVLSDLRDSGSIEQDADMVMFIYRPEMYFPDDTSLTGMAEVMISKQRNGPTGPITLSFIREIAAFENFAEDSAAEPM